MARPLRENLFESIELHLNDGLEMADCLADTGEETAQTLFRSSETELFESLY